MNPSFFYFFRKTDHKPIKWLVYLLIMNLEKRLCKKFENIDLRRV